MKRVSEHALPPNPNPGGWFTVPRRSDRRKNVENPKNKKQKPKITTTNTRTE